MPADEARPAPAGRAPRPPEDSADAGARPRGASVPSMRSAADQVADKVKGILRSPR